MKKKNAFTLAEVLITLGIIGIVAAMTLPILINKYEKKVTVTKLKKEYVMFNEAMDMLKVDKSVANIGNVGTCTEINQAILPYLNIRQSCAKPPYKCWGNENAPIDIDGDKLFTDPNDGSRGYKLADGSILVLRCWGAGLNVYVDINGIGKPNRLGRDIFTFYLFLAQSCLDNRYCDQNKVKQLKDGMLYGGSSGPNYVTYSWFTRDELLQSWCNKNSAQACTALIMMDGWEIKDEYPW